LLQQLAHSMPSSQRKPKRVVDERGDVLEPK
jgi:hypothetical protein